MPATAVWETGDKQIWVNTEVHRTNKTERPNRAALQTQERVNKKTPSNR